MSDVKPASPVSPISSVGSETVVKVSRAAKRFGEGDKSLLILDEVDFSLHKKEIAVVMGRSGSGKSTFLNLLAGLDTADSGEIFINGTPIHSGSEAFLADFRNRHIGFVFQSHNLLAEFTALENVMMPHLIRQGSFRQAKKRALELLEMVGLDQRRDQFIGKMSGGEQQRIAIARALVCRPGIILADEPTGNLDKENGKKVVEIFLNVCRHEGASVVLVTHAEEFADQCSVFYEIREKRLNKVIR